MKMHHCIWCDHLIDWWIRLFAIDTKHQCWCCYQQWKAHNERQAIKMSDKPLNRDEEIQLVAAALADHYFRNMARLHGGQRTETDYWHEFARVAVDIMLRAQGKDR